MKVTHFKKESLRLKEDVSGARMWAVALEKTMLTFFEVEPHCRFEKHQHEAEQITYVLEGNLYFEVDDEMIEVTAGEVIAIPSFIPHSAWTTDKPVKAIDAWSPPRKEYVIIE